MEAKNPGLRLTPIDGSTPHALNARNPYHTFNDGRIFAEVNRSSGTLYFLQRLRFEAAQLATRATNVDALLNHHLGGANPDAFVEFIRGEVLTWKSGRGPHPNTVKGWLASQGLLSDNAVTEDPWLVDRCERWLERVGKPGPKAHAKATDPNVWPNLKSLALFHAYRVEGGDTSADIDQGNADQVAHDAGHKAKSSGKTLLKNFRQYAHGLPEDKQRERTRDGRPGDVTKRLNLVIQRLAEYPNAVEAAEADRAFLRTRSNGSED